MAKGEVHGFGPKNAKIMLVGQCPGNDEAQAGIPLVGISGQQMERMCQSTGVPWETCYRTNVCRVVPPGGDIDRYFVSKTAGIKNGFPEYKGRYVHPVVMEGVEKLYYEIQEIKPNIIVGLGNTALWALTGEWGINSWRGSQMRLEDGTRFVPTYNPAAIVRQASLQFITEHDLRTRVAPFIDEDWVEPDWSFVLRPSFEQAWEYLDRWENHDGIAAVDIETRRGHIACVGIALSELSAICIPLMTLGS